MMSDDVWRHLSSEIRKIINPPTWRKKTEDGAQPLQSTGEERTRGDKVLYVCEQYTAHSRSSSQDQSVADERILSVRALRDGHFDFGQGWDGMDLKTAVSGHDRLGWDFLGIVLGLFGITKYFFLLSILRLSSTMTCRVAHLMFLDISPE
jgi:hypothetical protein